LGQFVSIFFSFKKRIEKEIFTAKRAFFPAKTLTLWQTKKLAFLN